MPPSDIERLHAWFEAGELLRPSADLPTSVHLAKALAAVCGVEMPEGGPASHIQGLIGDPRHLIFVLADGLGMNLVEARPESSFLRQHLELELRSVVPSSTAPAITSIATGLWPCEHGLPGWFVYLPEVRQQVIPLPFIERFQKRPLGQLGIEPASLFCSPTMWPQLKRSATAFQPAYIADSVYTRYLQGGASAVAYTTLADGFDKVLKHIDAAESPTYSYFYHPSIDTAEHEHGPDSTEVQLEVVRFEHELERLASRLAGQARIVLSADHGLMNVPNADKLLIKPDDDLSELLVTPPSGEPRLPIFHCRPGQAEEFARRFRAKFGQHFVLLTPDEVESLRLMGPVPLSAPTRSRLGDYVGISVRHVLVYASDAGVRAMKGFHGGLRPLEMRIPLILA